MRRAIRILTAAFIPLGASAMLTAGPTLAATGAPSIAAAQAIVSGQENTGDYLDPYFRISLFPLDRITTDITFAPDENTCDSNALLYAPSVTDFTMNSVEPGRIFWFSCAGYTQYEWNWVSPYGGLATLSIPSGEEAYTFVTTIRHGTTTTLSPLTPVRRLGSHVRLRARVTSPAGIPNGYCEVSRRYGDGKWALRHQVPDGPHGGCAATLTPALRGRWRYRVTFTSNGGSWAASTSAIRSTRVR